MALPENLRPASYRGVNFSVSAAKDVFGRSTVTHEFPQRGDPFVEDMGPAPRRIEIEAFCVGPDYAAQRDALMAALSEPGPATLVHPWLGSFLVSPEGPAEIAHTATEGLYCVLKLKFVRDSVPDSPGPALNWPSITNLRADLVEKLSMDSLEAAFKWAGAAAEAVNQGLAAVQSLAAAVLPILKGDFSGALTLAGQLAGLSGGPFVELIERAGGLASLLAPLWQSSEKNLKDHNRRDLATGLFDLTLEVPISAVSENLGTVRRQALENKMAVFQYQREMATAAALRHMAELKPESRAEARALRESALAAVDAVLFTTKNDETFTAFRSLAAAAQSALAEAAGKSPDVVIVHPAAVTPSLVLTWREVVRHGSARLETAEADLVVRNRLIHPGFVAPAEIEVLLNV